jgi:hypothetical protein
MVDILGALDDRNEYCEKTFLKKEFKSFIKRVRIFFLRKGLDYSKSLAGAFWYEILKNKVHVISFSRVRE